jgi:hypothetical protein
MLLMHCRQNNKNQKSKGLKPSKKLTVHLSAIDVRSKLVNNEHVL